MFGSGNGLAIDWWQAITWTDNDKIFVTIWCHQASVNSSWPSDAKWQHRSGSTLAQVMGLMAHYLMGTKPSPEVSWPSTFKGNRVSQEILKDIHPWYEFKNYWFKITAPSLMCQWFKVLLACRSREAVQSWCLETPCCEHTRWTISIIYHYGV